nr:unnamed protein product [Digitaria exilis]
MHARGRAKLARHWPALRAPIAGDLAALPREDPTADTAVEFPFSPPTSSSGTSTTTSPMTVSLHHLLCLPQSPAPPPQAPPPPAAARRTWSSTSLRVALPEAETMATGRLHEVWGGEEEE